MSIGNGAFTVTTSAFDPPMQREINMYTVYTLVVRLYLLDQWTRVE